MNCRILSFTFAAIALLALVFVSSSFAQSQADSVTVGEPIHSGAVTLWLLDGPDKTSHPYLTLEEALRTGRAAIHENNSQSLWIENRADTDLFLESSDLIKGGQQDRMIAHDMVVGARDTDENLNVYCIEHGRSTKRGTEPLETFSSSAWRAPLSHSRLVILHDLTGQLLTPHVGGLTAPDTNELNLLRSIEAMPSPFGSIDASQESVWNDVSEVQSGLTHVLRDSVTRNASPTSLELALEHESLADRNHLLERKLEHDVLDDPAALGFVYAIHGHIVGGEQYGSHALCAAMVPKLLRAICTEALLDTAGTPGVEPTLADVRNFIGSPLLSSKMAKESVNNRTEIEAQKSDESYRFRTIDTEFPKSDLHDSWIERDDP